MPKKILVADSSITIQKVFSFTFKGPDYSVAAVGDAATALAKAKEMVPDLIVLDLSLSPKKGYEVFQEIRKNSQLQKAVGLILVSANETFDQEKGRKVGVLDFLVKPFDTQTLTNKVKELLSRPPRISEPVTGPQNLPPLTMADEPSLIRFTRSTLEDKPKHPVPVAAASDEVQAVDQDLEPEPVEFAEVESLEPEPELEPAASLGPESEPEFVSLDQVGLEPTELEGEKPTEANEEELELEEIVLDEELAHEMEPETLEVESLDLETRGGGMDDIVFDVVEDGSAPHFEAKLKKPAAPDLSALDDLPLAEAEEVEELPELEEVAPVEELDLEPAPEALEEVPPEIPYAEAVEEELGLEAEPPVSPEEAQLDPGEELEAEPELEEAQLQELTEETPALETEDLELKTEPLPPGNSELIPTAEQGPESALEPVEMESEPAAPDGAGLEGAIPTELEEEMPEQEFIAIEKPEPRRAPPAPKLSGPGGPGGREARPEEENRLAAETFEKVAWEVVPDLVDRLVREMVKERIEKVAWEVVPDLAERLILEEIRKLEAQAGKE
ncbi:MAG: response regulator [Proteobacteria bacterium]|nr:response regulator [Pseudomonadota bacterium]